MRKLSIGKNKGIFFLIVMLFGFTTMRGEDNNIVKEKILEIKLNDDFIFGEGISDDREIAYGIAMEDLLLFANDLKESNSQEKLSMSDLLTKVETLVYENGSRYEVIVYIPLKTVIETERKEPSARSGIMITKSGFEVSDDETEAEENVSEIEEEETRIADKLPEEKMIAEQESVSSLVTPSEEKAEETPQEEEKVEEPVLTEKQTGIVEKKPAREIPRQVISSEEAGEVEDFLVTQDNFSEIKSFLSDMKRKGKIVETGAMETLSGIPEDASLILIDEMGGILAVLSPATSQGRINYRSHKPDSENNYNIKFIVWYKK